MSNDWMRPAEQALEGHAPSTEESPTLLRAERRRVAGYCRGRRHAALQVHRKHGRGELPREYQERHLSRGLPLLLTIEAVGSPFRQRPEDDIAMIRDLGFEIMGEAHGEARPSPQDAVALKTRRRAPRT